MMKCADLKFIEAFLRGDSAPQAQREFEEHLASCSVCREALERENRFDDLLRRQPLITAPKGLSTRVMGSLDSRRAPYSISDRLWAIGLGMVLAAVGAVIGYGGGGWVRAIYSRVSQWLPSAGALESARTLISPSGSHWLDQVMTGNSIFLLNFLVAGIVLCWGLWQMVKVLRR